MPAAAATTSQSSQPRDSGAETEKPPEPSTTENEPNGDTGGDGGGAEAPSAEEPGAEPPAAAVRRISPAVPGDEIPARSQALITGRGGRLSPRRVFVPPFISVRVELRSADGAEYSLSGGGKTTERRRGVARTTADFDGLRPGRTLVLGGPTGRVAVVASAEPGP